MVVISIIQQTNASSLIKESGRLYQPAKRILVSQLYRHDSNPFKLSQRFFSSQQQKSREIMEEKEVKEKKVSLFSGSVPKQKIYTEKDLIHYDLVKRVATYTTLLDKETGLLKFPEAFNISEKNYDFALLNTPHRLHEKSFLSGLNTFYDRRALVERPYEYPWYLNGYLLTRFKKDIGFRGTGFLIGDKYALTAKHCVMHDNEIASDAEFLLGATPNSVLRKTFAKNIFVHEELDLALLELNSPVGLELGWAGLREASEKDVFGQDFLVTVSGYPGQKSFLSYYGQQERRMFQMEGTVSKIVDDHISYLLDTSRGQSGAGIWRRLEDRVEGYGIHTTGTGDPIRGNSGVRVNSKFLTFIEKHMK